METVVLLHGLGRTRRSMRPVARDLERRGYRVLNIGYPSTRHRLPGLAAIAAARIEAALGGDTPPRLHFVGHSLGCLIIRWLVAHRPPAPPGRIVLLTPPNQGSKVADLVLPWLGWLLRPLRDLTVAGGIARAIPTPPGTAIGVIAGTRDRTVKRHETALAGEVDRAEVPYMHSFVMNHADVREMVARFLATGRFGPARP